MRKSVLIVALFLLMINKLLAQCPSNIGFEDGTFNGWQCYAGGIDEDGVITVTPVTPTDNIHTIYDASTHPGLDQFGLFPVVCPNGSKYSVRLGNDLSEKGAERMTYTFNVPVGEVYSLILNYAVVLQNPSHERYQQPKFTAQIFDVTDEKYIDCPSFNFEASSSLPGFKLAQKTAGAQQGRNPVDIYYKEWSATTISLKGYAGKTVRLEFTTNDCTRGAHFGYAYFDINENCGQPITGNAYCNDQPQVVLHAPGGFSDYKWFKDGDFSQPAGQGGALTIKPAPPNQTKYAVVITPYLGIGCTDTLYTVINKIDADFKLKVADTITICKGLSADLTSAAVTAGSTAGLTLSYHTDPVSLDYIYSPQRITQAGNYYIQAISPEGCSNILPVYVKVIDPKAFTFPNITLTYPQQADLTKAYTPVVDYTYSFFSNKEATTALANYQQVGTGTYFIKVTSKLGCETIVPVQVIINPPPPYVISAPTAFTPNN